MKKRKVKLFASIASLGLVVAVMGVGVWAATQQAVKVSSQVSFTATSVAADIKLSVNNAVQGGNNATGTADQYAAMGEYDIVKAATLSEKWQPADQDKGIPAETYYAESDLYKHLLYSEAVPTEITEEGENKGKYTTGDPIGIGKDRGQARRIAYFNNDTAKTLYENRVYLNLQDKDEDGYLNIGAQVVYTFTIEALSSSAPIYYHITANLFDTPFYTSDAQVAYKISDVFEVQIFDNGTLVAGNPGSADDTYTTKDVAPSKNATANDVTTKAGLGDGQDVTDDEDALYPTAILKNWTAGITDTTKDAKAIQPGETREIQVVYTVKDIDGDKTKVPTNANAEDLYQGISYTMKSLQLGDIYIKLANNGNNIDELPNYAPGIDSTGFDKVVDWTTSKDDKPEGTVVPGNVQGGD